jgi:hypothetical protein
MVRDSPCTKNTSNIQRGNKKGSKKGRKRTYKRGFHSSLFPALFSPFFRGFPSPRLFPFSPFLDAKSEKGKKIQQKTTRNTKTQKKGSEKRVGKREL